MQRIGVYEHDVGIVSSEEGDEVAGVAQANEGFVGVDDGEAVANAVSVLLEMVGGDLSTDVCISL